LAHSNLSLSLEQIEERLLSFARQHGQIRRNEVTALTGLSQDQAYRLLKRFVKQGKLKQASLGRTAYYRAC
jgi:DNA-binding IclR family transcriptional regulator